MRSRFLHRVHERRDGEMADTRDLESRAERHVGSTPAPATTVRDVLVPLCEMLNDFRDTFGYYPNEVRVSAEMAQVLREAGLNTVGGVRYGVNTGHGITMYAVVSDLSQPPGKVVTMGHFDSSTPRS